MKKCLLLCVMAVFLIILCSSIYATDITIPTTFGQNELKNFAKELGGALAYRQYQPAKPLGLTGFDVGIQVNANPIKSKDIWDKVMANDAPDMLPVPMVFVKKGLPLNIDLGIRGLPIPGTNITLMGGNLKYSILEGTVATPAVGISVDYSQVSGSDDFDLNVMTVNASVSKGFAIITPYAGVASDQINMKIKNDLLKNPPAGTGLKDEKASATRLFAGLKLSPLPLLAITAEVNMADVTSYGIALGVGF
ncbi:MAG: hypothetical protein HY934_02205 [Candidatus Firestonebacteria bacterium]|nr:hypothetical protein [Candidatus Firestonebacteria bacterium]